MKRLLGTVTDKLRLACAEAAIERCGTRRRRRNDSGCNGAFLIEPCTLVGRCSGRCAGRAGGGKMAEIKQAATCKAGKQGDRR